MTPVNDVYTLETDILTRLYEINKTEPRITALRYFPADVSRARLPIVVAMPGTALHSHPATHLIDTTRNFPLYCLAGDWNEGVPSETAQRNAELLFAVMRALYGFNRRRLELNRQALDGITNARLASDTGLVDRFGKASVILSLEVTYQHAKA